MTDETTKPAKKKNFSKQYYQIPEEELQIYILKAKDGDPSAQMKLLEIFHPYFNKYLMLLYHGKYDLGFYDIRRFIGLFVPDKGLNFFLIRNKLNKDGVSKVNDVIKGLVYMINRYGTEEDLMQTIHMTFLQCLERYNPKTNDDGELIPFSGFLYNYFFYLLSRHIKQLHIDQLGRRTFPLMLSSDNDSSEDFSQMKYQEPADPKELEANIGAEFIDEFWVLGETCSFPFNKLTVKERQILKWKYVDGLKAAEIKKRITEHPNTTRESINKIKSTIRDEINEE